MKSSYVVTLVQRSLSAKGPIVHLSLYVHYILIVYPSAEIRPPVDDIVSFLHSQKNWIIPNLFADHDINEVAHGLAGEFHKARSLLIVENVNRSVIYINYVRI